MGFRKKLAMFEFTICFFVEIGLFCGLFTNTWIIENGNHMGIRRYCNDSFRNDNCEPIEDILPNLKGNI